MNGGKDSSRSARRTTSITNPKDAVRRRLHRLAGDGISFPAGWSTATATAGLVRLKLSDKLSFPVPEARVGALSPAGRAATCCFGPPPRGTSIEKTRRAAAGPRRLRGAGSMSSSRWAWRRWVYFVVERHRSVRPGQPPPRAGKGRGDDAARRPTPQPHASDRSKKPTRCSDPDFERPRPKPPREAAACAFWASALFLCKGLGDAGCAGQGSVAITGAARGVSGRNLPAGLAAAGARIVAGDHQRLRRDARSGAERPAGEAVGVRLDVYRPPPRPRPMVRSRERAPFGRLDALINNAALYGRLAWRPVRTRSTKAEWDAADGGQTSRASGIAARRRLAGDAAIDRPKARAAAAIVNIASLAANLRHCRTGLHYTTSKAAVDRPDAGPGRRELGRDRIRVNALAPSAVMTEGNSRVFSGAKLDRALDAIKDRARTIQRNFAAIGISPARCCG